MHFENNVFLVYLWLWRLFILKLTVKIYSLMCSLVQRFDRIMLLAGLFFFSGLIFTGQAALISTAQTCNDSTFATTKNGYTRWTVLRDGDFILQGIFTQTKGVKCSTANLEGTINVVVMQYAIENIYKANSLPGFRLGYQFDNGCEDIPKVMERGIEIVSMYRPNSVCRADFLDCNKNGSELNVKPIASVIGPGYSYLTIPLASLMGLYGIPHISYQASSRLLSKVNLYKSFFRTIPPDTNQVLVMLDIMQRFNWNYLFAVGSDDDYGKLAISALKDSSQSRNICIAYDEYIPNSKTSMQARVTEIVKKIKSNPKASLVVLFTYSSMGAMILNEAEKQGIQRIWLTSDAWSSRGASLNVSKKYLEGILTVATEKAVIPGLTEFLKQKIQNEAHCNPWLELYLKQKFHCSVDKGKHLMECPGQTPESMASLMLERNSGGYGNLYDAVYTVSNAINAMLKQKCHYLSQNFNKSLCKPFDSKELLYHMYGVNFTGIFNRSVSFDKFGDPQNPHYIIENIQEVNGKLQYVQVGTWHKDNDKIVLDLNEKTIVWPHPHKKAPASKCSRDCQPGEYVHAKTECCFSCQDCNAQHISTSVNSPSCIACPNGHHTDAKKTKCIKTPIVYLTTSSAGGAAILSMSIIGMAFTLLLLLVFIKIKNSSVVRESQPSVIFISILLLFFSFAYGIAHVTKPNDAFCSGRSAYFFLIFGIFSGILFTSTRFIKDSLTSAVNHVFTVSSEIVQFIVISIIVLIQLISVIIWLKVDPVKVESFVSSDEKQIILECKVDMSTSRLICMFLPCITLVLATIISFRERNQEHPYNEPKFLSFTTMALTIVVVAFIPTFKFVVGIYKAIVMAFTVDVWAYTYIGCIFIPKLRAYAVQKFHTIDNTLQDNAINVHDLNGSDDHSDGKQGLADTPENNQQKRFSFKETPTAQEVYLLKKVSLTSLPSPQLRTEDSTEPKTDADSAKNLVYRI